LSIDENEKNELLGIFRNKIQESHNFFGIFS